MKHIRYSGLLLCIFLLSLMGNRGYSQIAITTDSTGCASTSITLYAAITGDVPTESGITLDDGYSAVIPIGFNFNFYGTTYTEFVFGSNGMLSFDPTLAGMWDPWPITAPLLGNSSAYNSICGPWCDVYIPAGGTMTYSTIGTAPYRKFMATWCHTAMYSCTDEWLTTQIIMYETTNIIETHIGHHTSCSWNGGNAIVGVQNADGSAATVAPGRDYPDTWVATNEAWRFTPDSAVTSYSVSSITFAPVPYASSVIAWYDSATGAYLGSGSSITLYPTVPTTYVATAAGCSDSTYAYFHALPPGSVGSGTPGSVNLHITSSVGISPSVCGVCNGQIVLSGINPGEIDTVFYTFNGVPQPPTVSSAGTDSVITITGLCAGIYDAVYVKVGNCISNAVTDTLIDPPVHAAFNTDATHLGCTQDTLYCTNLSSPLGATGYVSNWTFGDGSPVSTVTSPMHIYTNQGTYTVKLEYTNGVCTDTASATITFYHPLASVYTVSSTAVCLGTPITFTNSSVGTDPHYMWTFADGTTSTDENPPVHNFLAGGTYNTQLSVTDFLNCVSTSTISIDVVDIHIHTDFHDTSVCLRDSMQLLTYVTYVPASGVSGLAYVWTPTNNIGDATAATPNFAGIGDYHYEVTVTALPLGCTATDTEDIHSYAPVVLTGVTASQSIANGSSIQLNSDGALIYAWTPNNGTLDNPNINNPVATPVDSNTTYVVHGMNLYGCLDSAEVTIHVDYGTDEFIPMAFTPNNDGLNDLFRISNLKYHHLVDFRVFDRWGKEVFHTSNPEIGWDGTYNGEAQDMGVYNYTVIVARPDGVQKTYSGNVTLLR